MDAGIVLIAMRPFLSPGGPNYSHNVKHMANPRKKDKTAKKASGKAKVPRKTAPAKAGKTLAKGKPKTRQQAGQRQAWRKGPAGSKSDGKTAASTREKLMAVRPSGGKDDSFFELVHQVARQIPRGRVTSFGAIGAALGTRSSARMVGWAMNTSHLSPQPVPAHRVVNSVGLLTGRHHFKPPERMQELLEKEGVLVKDNKVVEFKKLFWDPAKEL